jgi:putative oxidoreductase
MNSILHPVARFLVSLIFILSGIGKIFNFSGVSEMMAGKGFPAPDLFLVGAIVLELVGGLFLLFGYRTRIGAILLIIFIVPATIIFHAPNIAEQQELNNMMKNIAIIGALVKFIVDGAGAFSVDERGA